MGEGRIYYRLKVGPHLRSVYIGRAAGPIGLWSRRKRSSFHEVAAPALSDCPAAGVGLLQPVRPTADWVLAAPVPGTGELVLLGVSVYDLYPECHAVALVPPGGD